MKKKTTTKRKSLYERAVILAARHIPVDPSDSHWVKGMRAWCVVGYCAGYRAAKRDARKKP